MVDNMKVNEKFLFLCGKSARKDENLFSDIVKYMCDVNEEFLNILFRLCFRSSGCEVEPCYILREQQIAEDSRIDFAIQTKEHGIYYIENKIADRNIVKNAEKYIGHLNGKYGKEANKHLTYILPCKNYDKEPSRLEEIGVNCVFWEEFLDKCLENDKFHEFAIILSSIIQYYPTPNEVEIQDFKKKCDKLNCILSSKYSNEKIDNWSKGCFYGYYLIDSLTFGVNFCPTKGLFFCFTYNYKQYEKFVKDKVRKINHQMNLKYLKPLGKFHNDEDIYIEILKENEHDSDISEERFIKASKELGRFIQVVDGEKGIPLDEYIKMKKDN